MNIITLPTPSRTRRGMLGLAATTAAALTLFVAAPASAHIRIDGAATATAGTTAAITFRVPTESDTASTVGVTVTFPADTPFGSVSPLYKPGWTVEVTKADLATPVTDSTGKELTSYVTTVTWTATDGGIPPEIYDTFTVRAGAVPDAESIAFPALQTYSDGSTVDWSEIAQGGATPEHPAPVLIVVPAADSTTSTPAPSSAAPSASAPSVSAETDTEANTDGEGGDAGVGLGIAGLVAGVLGLAAGGIALARGGRKATAEK